MKYLNGFLYSDDQPEIELETLSVLGDRDVSWVKLDSGDPMNINNH